MKKIFVFGILVTLIFGPFISTVFAGKPDFVAFVDKAKGPVVVTIPDHAVQVADDVFSLGSAVVDGKMVQGFLFVHYREGFAKPPWAGSGKGNGETTSYSFLAKGARWKTTEAYVLDTSNTDGLSDDFVASRIEASLSEWDVEVSFEIFGNSDTTTTVDGADTVNPDDKNEIFFGSIEEPGAIAVTIVWGIFYGPPKARELVKYDMVFDDVDFGWGDAGPTNEENLGDTSIMDLQNIATHEIGHAAGMGHPADSCTEETMYRFAAWGETKKRTLNTGDIAGIQELYR